MALSLSLDLDPANWAADFEGGSRYGYALLLGILGLRGVIAFFLQ